MRYPSKIYSAGAKANDDAYNSLGIKPGISSCLRICFVNTPIANIILKTKQATYTIYRAGLVAHHGVISIIYK
jgi:hypothetical protein